MAENFYDELVVQLECPVCTNYMLPPIRQCATGHSVCESCRRKLHKCPLCQGKFTGARNFTLEGLAVKMHYPCINKASGCNVKLSYTERETHELCCPLKGFKCAMEKCLWVGKLEDLAAHWASKKMSSKPYHKNNICHTKMKAESYYVNIVDAYNKLFWFKCKLSKNKLYWSLQYLGNAAEAENYSYEIEIFKPGRAKKKIFMSDYCQTIDLENQQLFNDGSCISISADAVSSFVSAEQTLIYYFRVNVVKEEKTEKTEQVNKMQEVPAKNGRGNKQRNQSKGQPINSEKEQKKKFLNQPKKVQLMMGPNSHQIIKSHSDKTITLDEETLRSILMQDEIRNRCVSVVSITGAFRQGKSFLLNSLLRYLRIKYIEKRDVSEWLKPDDGPLWGVSGASGSRRHTNGIHMWSEIFLTKIPSGEDVAIIVLDTQGSFDNQSTMDDSTRIFALSTLISSVQVYNVMQGIKRCDLTHLECFRGFGNLLTNSGTAPFQNLWFLVKDWACDYEHPYGFTGGSHFLNKLLSSDNSEVKDQVDNIKELFSKISCFLMPRPGRVVDTSNSLDGDLDEIDVFKQQVHDFVPMLLSPENLVLKTVGGRKIKAEELIFYISEYSSVLKDGSLPKIETIFKATVEALHRSASFRAFKLYKKNMDADVNVTPRCCRPDVFFKKHKRKCFDYFHKLKKIDNMEICEKYLIELNKKMEEEFSRYKTINDENLRQFEESKRRMDQQIQRSPQPRTEGNPRAGGSDTSTLGTAEAVGIAAGVIGAGAVLAFGISKLFGSSRGKND